MGNNSHTALKIQLAVMSTLQFGVWGCYLISLGNFLSHAGLARQIGWFYAVQCIVSLFMPALVGFVADRWLEARRMLGICNLLVAIFFSAAAFYSINSVQIGFWPLFGLFACGTAFFMPAIGLSNAIIFKSLRKASVNPESVFPIIRLFGTLGFIAGMLAVNFARLQSSPYQLLLAAAIAGILVLYSLSLPATGLSDRPQNGMWFNALTLCRQTHTRIFLIFCIFVGVALQVTNSFGNVFISQFGSLEAFAGTWGAANANAIIAVSQISEAVCILLLPFCIRRFGIRNVILIAIAAWSLRFLFLSLGDTGSGLWLLIASGIVYGIAFDFFNIAGNVYIDRAADSRSRAGAQGLFMAMSSGIGGTLGLVAAQTGANRLVFSAPSPQLRYEGWVDFWFMFALYALVLAVLFLIWIKRSSASGTSK